MGENLLYLYPLPKSYKMNEKTILEKNLKNIVPVFEDKRGKIIDVLEDENIKHIGIITSNKGSIRGNHYHKKSTQWTYIISGKIKIYLKNFDNGDMKEIILNRGDLIKIPVMSIHTLESIGNSTMLVLTDQHRIDESYEYDTFRIKIR